MYECLMQTLRTFLGYGVLRTSLFIALIIITLVCIACTSGSFRKIINSMRERGGWRGILAELGTGIFKLAILLLVCRLLITGLNYQADIFSREHGRVTERNRSAILMKWGSPHEQRELSVNHYRKRIWVTRQLMLKLDDKKNRVYAESYWKDQPLPVMAVDNVMPSVISEKEEEREVLVSQKSIISADISISIKSNPRRLGNANYAGYDDNWQLSYVITNKSKWDTTASIYLPLPAKTGFFNDMVFNIDGISMLNEARTEDNGVFVRVPMVPVGKKKVVVGYQSRGLEHLRYIPARMSISGHYRVNMKLEGIPAAKLDYPIGSMPPMENLQTIKDDNYELNWQLDDALTSYDVGIKLPDVEQPEYHFAYLLYEAPVGLVMLLIILSVPALIAGRKIRVEIILVMSLLYCLHYTFMGRLADLMNGFVNPFMISAIVILSVAFLFRLRQKDTGMLRFQDAGIFLVMTVLFPLAVIAENRDLWMQIFYIGIVSYIAVLILFFQLNKKAQIK